MNISIKNYCSNFDQVTTYKGSTKMYLYKKIEPVVGEASAAQAKDSADSTVSVAPAIAEDTSI